MKRLPAIDPGKAQRTQTSARATAKEAALQKGITGRAVCCSSGRVYRLQQFREASDRRKNRSATPNGVALCDFGENPNWKSAVLVPAVANVPHTLLASAALAL